jgi:sulfate permease, SulP family
MQLTPAAPAPSFTELYTPKLVTVLREGYGIKDFRADLLAGLTVAIVALPLSMAIAIASGVTPASGLYTSIAGGFAVSLLAGGRFQIGGPAGAYIVLVAATVAQYGAGGLLIATLLSGALLLSAGFLRLGAFIKYIPYPVTIGFTAGIAVIILASQLKEFLGLTLPGAEPGPFIPKVRALTLAFPTMNVAAIAIGSFVVAAIIVLRRYRPHWPGFLLAVVVAALGTWALHLPLATIGSRFGAMPRSLPAPHWPTMSLADITRLLPAAASFALLGGIESLLCAVVADSMTGRRHRSNMELVGQGVANITAALFGGICVTGAIARTATNIRAGARGPIAGMLHALFLLLFLVVAAPLTRYIPLAALAGVLVVVAWNMAEKQQFATLLKSRGDAVVLLSTFLLVVFRDLTAGILVGFALGTLLLLHRMAQSVEVGRTVLVFEPDVADEHSGSGRPYDPSLATDPDIIVYRISGAFFFGATARVADALNRMGERPKAYIIDFLAVPLIDATAAATIEGFVRKARRQHVAIVLSSARPEVLAALRTHGVRGPNVLEAADIPNATLLARQWISKNQVEHQPVRARPVN